MTKEELEKDYYADRPTEPYSDDNSPNDWANIAHYAEENLEKTFERIAELEKENAELKAENEANENGAKKYAEFYFQTNEQLTKAKEIVKKLIAVNRKEWVYSDEIEEAEQFLKEVNYV